MSRVRARFGRGPQLKFISHLDITRLWHRALRRAKIIIAYSEGFNPHPKISLAAPLQLGVTSDAELIDIFLAGRTTPQDFTQRVQAELPAGLDVLQAFSVPYDVRALQAQVAYADYTVKADAAPGVDIAQAVFRLMSSLSIPWRHLRDTGIKSYDLRPLIVTLSFSGFENDKAVLNMRLRCGAGGTGRPEQVIKALGMDRPLSIHRTRLILEA